MEDYPVPIGNAVQTQYGGEKMLRAPTLKTRLEAAVMEAEERLAEAKRAKEIFEKHPELEELLNIMNKGRF
jgi:hypothetical protein